MSSPVTDRTSSIFRVWSYWFPLTFLALAIGFTFVAISNGPSQLPIPAFLLFLSVISRFWVRAKCKGQVTRNSIQLGFIEAAILSIAIGAVYSYLASTYKAVPPAYAIGLWFFLGAAPMFSWRKGES